jgi:glycosyltransferase involved in cell wall biosynthesis
VPHARRDALKIGVLTQYYPPEMGAAPVRLSELVARLRERGHEVVVLTAMPNYPGGKVFDGYGGLFRRERVDGVEVLRSWVWPSLRPQFVPRTISYFSFTASAAIAGALKLPRVDVLVTESPPLPLGLAGYVLSRLRRAKLVFNVSDLLPETAVHVGILDDNSFATRLAYRLEAFCYRKAWRVSVQSSEIRESIEQRFPRVHTLPLPGGVDTSLFDPSLRDEEVRTRLFGERPVVALYAGLHGILQGLDQLIDAADALRERTDLTIALIGDGPVKGDLVADAQRRGLDNVRFVDVQPRALMPQIVASADIALVPLRTRLPGAVPSKLYEAMASGKPVVMAADGEPAEILARSGAGLSVSTGDVAGFAAALDRLASSPEERERMGAAGRAAAVARHDRRVICDRFIDALEERA